MMKIIILSFTILVFLSCSSQKNVAGIKDHAFYQVRIPGMVQQDPAGSGDEHVADTFTVVFIELKGTPPQWNGLWKGNHSYAVKTIEIRQWPHSVGINSEDGKKIELSPSDGYKLFFLELKKDSKTRPAPVAVPEGEMLLEGKLNGQQVILRISRMIQLVTPRFQGPGKQ